MIRKRGGGHEGGGVIDPEHFNWRYAAAVAGMALFAALQDAERAPIGRRVVKILASALLTVGVAADLAAVLGISEIAAAVVVMGLGFVVLDLVVGLIGDREFIKDVIRRRLGGGAGGGDGSNP